MSKEADKKTQADNLQNVDITNEAQRVAREIMKQFTQNEVILGATLVEAIEDLGGIKKDRETGEPIIDEFTGEPTRYPSKFYAILDFKGGSIKTVINESQYQTLSNKVGCDFSCRGRLAPVTNYGKTNIEPVFSAFVEL